MDAVRAEPAPPSRLERSSGRVAIAVAAAGSGPDRLARLHEEGCARIRLPRSYGGLREAVLLNTAGGLADGDVIDQAVTVGAGARLVVTTQAAEKVYRARGTAPGSIATRLTVGAGGRLGWWPQEAILFDGARLRRRTVIELAAGGYLLAMEAVVLGRAARREAVVSGLLDERCELRLAGRLVWSDRLRLEGDVEALRRARACLNGAGAFATILAVGGDPDGLLERLRERVADGEVRAGASRRCGLVVARLLAPREAALRRVLLRVITTLGADLVGPAVVAQRVWRC